MIKRPSKKKIQLWYLIFIYYSLPLNPSLFFSFEQLVWHSKSLKGGLKYLFIRYSFNTNLEIGHSLFIQINRFCTECYTRESKSFFWDDVTLNKNVYRSCDVQRCRVFPSEQGNVKGKTMCTSLFCNILIGFPIQRNGFFDLPLLRFLEFWG